MKKNLPKNRIIILGADGMLGNAIFRYLKLQNLNVVGSSRKNAKKLIFFDASCFNEDIFHNLIKKAPAKFIINCIGYIRPENEGMEEVKKSLKINSIFPQQLSTQCIKNNIRLIHFSTDCIFSGNNGPYKEDDIPDERNIYGITKLLGEVRELPNITIRTSIIGREIKKSRNLLDWFLSSRDKEIYGFKNVYWNGISTITAAKIINRIIKNNIHFKKPVIQICSETTNKYELLKKFKDIYKKNVIIKAEKQTKANKTLIASDEQKQLFQDLIPSIRQQIKELKKFYE